MFGSESARPAPPPLPDPLPSPPTLASGGDRNRPAGNTNKIPSFGGTLLTSGEGVTAPASTTKKSLLGL